MKIMMILKIGKDKEEIKAGGMVTKKMIMTIMIVIQEAIIREEDLEV